MTLYFFATPDSPLVLRTGRPFGAADEGGGGDTQSFPMPGTNAGALRAAWCDAAGHVHHPKHDKTVATIDVRGPLRCTVQGAATTLWVPAPADAQFAAVLTAGRLPRAVLLRLQRQPGVASRTNAAHAAGCDLPHGLKRLLVPGDYADVKPASGWWRLDDIKRWLAGDSAHPQRIQADLPVDVRTHVAIDAPTQQARLRGLFQSAGVDFTLPSSAGDVAQGFVSLVDVPDELQARIKALHGWRGRVGADGATVAYQMLEAPTADWATGDALLAQLEALQVGNVLRMLLITPACYLRNGWYPDGLRPTATDGPIEGSLVGLPGWRFRLVAAAVGRHLTHSGMAMRANSPTDARKPLRRLVPAGSVYWLQVLEREANAPSVGSRWLQSTCYAEFARDGHGLALWGIE